MRIGVTAARALNERGEQNITAALADVAGTAEMVITGGAIGGDAFAARCAHGLRLWVRTIFPLSVKEVDPDWRLYADEAEGPYEYRERNERIVDQCSVLYAFPAFPEDHPRSRRSGTWLTIRMARKAGKPVKLWVQDPGPSRGAALAKSSTRLDKPRGGGLR